MNCKKIIAKFLLLSSIIVMSGCFSKIQANVSTEEWNEINKIEEQRHNEDLRDTVIQNVLKF